MVFPEGKSMVFVRNWPFPKGKTMVFPKGKAMVFVRN